MPRVLRSDLMVLFMTGYAEMPSLPPALSNPVVTPPFAMEALATRVRAIMTGR